MQVRLLVSQRHRVDRVLGFFSSRPKWDSPTPAPAGEYAPPPLFPGGGDTLACGRRGGVPIRTRGQTLRTQANLSVEHTVQH